MNNKNKKQIIIIIGIMCFLLAFAISMQIKTVKNSNSTISQDYEENNLRAEVLKYKEKYDRKYEELEKAEKELEDERQEATTEDNELKDMEEKIKEGNKLIGFSEVTGPGVILTLSDSKMSANSAIVGDLNELLVHDMDVLNVINELKNAGAEAISINDQRLIPTSSISCGGNIITINGERVGAPFEIKAIGLPEQLAALSRPGGYLSILKDYGIGTDLKKSESITIPKYAGVIEFKYAKTSEK